MSSTYPRTSKNDIQLYYDAEFTGLHRDTTLISVGFFSAEHLSYFYAEFTDYDASQVDEWLKSHVINNLLLDRMDENTFEKYDHPNGIKTSIRVKGTRAYIADQLLKWMSSLRDENRTIVIHTDCYAYDWVLFNDLICKDGLALNLPEWISYIPIDLSTALYSADIDPDINREKFLGDKCIYSLTRFKLWKNAVEPKHNSLWDALVIALCFMKLIMEDRVCTPQKSIRPIHDMPAIFAAQYTMPEKYANRQ